MDLFVSCPISMAIAACAERTQYPADCVAEPKEHTQPHTLLLSNIPIPHHASFI